MLENVIWKANDTQNIQSLVLTQGDSLKISGRIPLTSLSSEVLPVVNFLAIDKPNPTTATQTIGPKAFTVTLNSTLTTADVSLILAPTDTSALILDEALGMLLGLQPSDSRYFQPAKKFFFEIQLTALYVNKSWQGSLIIQSDFLRTNIYGTLPGLT